MTLTELASSVDGELRGNGNEIIHAVAPLHKASPGTVAFLVDGRYKKFLADTHASAVILGRDDADACPVAAIIVHRPYVAYAHAARLLHPGIPVQPGVHPSSTLGRGCHIDSGAHIGPHCAIGDDVIIENGVVIGPGCTIERECLLGAGSHLVARVSLGAGTRLGPRCLIHAGAVIGSDGFGLAHDGTAWIKVPQLGAVRLGAEVEIGANTTIDRGALEDTVLEDGVKLDNQIQVAHNVHIGAHTAIAGCTGIAGSVRIGARCTIGGSVGIAGHLEIVDDVHITGMSFVTKSIHAPGLYSSGMPLQDNRQWRKNSVRLKQLDELARRIKALEQALATTTK